MKANKLAGIEILQFENIPKDEFCHFTTTRKGGYSKGDYSSLNLGSNTGDLQKNIDRNWKVFCEATGINKENMYTPYQIHENKVIRIDEDFLKLNKGEQETRLYGNDAIITNVPNVCIYIETADCVPILLFDPVNKAIAAIHAGWRGTVEQVAKQTVLTMQKEYGSNPARMLAGIGPSISPDCFEVGDEVGDAFREIGYSLEDVSYRHERTNKLQLNLWDTNKIQLLVAGISEDNIEIAKLCTYKKDEKFFSARRQKTQAGRTITGGYIKQKLEQ